MSVKLLTEHHLEFQSLKGDCRGSSESALVKMPHCWKSHVTAHILSVYIAYLLKMMLYNCVQLSGGSTFVSLMMMEIGRLSVCLIEVSTVSWKIFFICDATWEEIIIRVQVRVLTEALSQRDGSFENPKHTTLQMVYDSAIRYIPNRYHFLTNSNFFKH